MSYMWNTPITVKGTQFKGVGQQEKQTVQLAKVIFMCLKCISQLILRKKPKTYLCFSGLSFAPQAPGYHFEHMKKQVKTACGRARLEIMVPCSQSIFSAHKPHLF